MLVIALVVLSSQLGPKPNVASANSVSTTEANSPSIPNYQWQFLSASEKAAVDASLQAVRSQRIKNVTLSIVDEKGQPYTGPLRIIQESTTFLSDVGTPNEVDNPGAGTWSHFLAIDSSRSEMLWPQWKGVERVRGSYQLSWVDSQYQDGVQHGVVVFRAEVGPYLTGGDTASWTTIPDWAKSLDYASLKGNMSNYLKVLVNHFAGKIAYYDLWTEANAYYGNGNWPLDRIIDIIRMEATTIRSIDPNAKICIKLDNISPDSLKILNRSGNSNWTTEYFVQQLVSAGVPFDIIGLETHYGSGEASRAGGVDTLYNRLITLATLGKPVYVWEDGITSFIDSSYQDQMTGVWWTGPWHGSPSEAKQAEYMVAETIVYLGNPSVTGVHWEDLTDEGNSTQTLFYSQFLGVLNLNGKEKLAYYALGDLWGNLTLNEVIQSTNGVAAFSGLAGRYSISSEGYEANPSVISVSEGKQNMFSLVLRSTTSITGITSTTSGSVTANKTVPAPAPQPVENPVLILAGALGIAIVLLAAIILRRRKPSS